MVLRLHISNQSAEYTLLHNIRLCPWTEFHAKLYTTVLTLSYVKNQLLHIFLTLSWRAKRFHPIYALTNFPCYCNIYYNRELITIKSQINQLLTRGVLLLFAFSCLDRNIKPHILRQHTLCPPPPPPPNNPPTSSFNFYVKQEKSQMYQVEG